MALEVQNEFTNSFFELLLRGQKITNPCGDLAKHSFKLPETSASKRTPRLLVIFIKVRAVRPGFSLI
jgi:hypothetical protein